MARPEPKPGGIRCRLEILEYQDCPISKASPLGEHEVVIATLEDVRVTYNHMDGGHAWNAEGEAVARIETWDDYPVTIPADGTIEIDSGDIVTHGEGFGRWLLYPIGPKEGT